MRAGWLVVIGVSGACVPATRSGELACSVDPDCEDGRVCERGFCVVGGEADAGVDTGDADSFDCTTFNGKHFQGCDLPRPDAALVLAQAGTYTFDTDSGALVAPDATTTTPASAMLASGRAISVEALTVAAGARLRVLGAKPLIVAAWSTIEIAGVLDAASTGTEAGAGANPTECATHAATAGQPSTDGAGGGGGGGFQGAGGAGGRGDAGNGGPGGAAISPPLLLGGCPGAAGGNGNQAGGAGGAGGGAVQLTAKDSITIRGTLHAGGAGGRGATSVGGDADGGGGGGGSGGMLGLESTAITIEASAILAANGGGGGGGAENQPGGPGQDGQPSATRATGGTEVNAGLGGLGSGGAILSGGAGQESPAHGAGGGGGGAGVIVLSSTSAAVTNAGAIVSPAATIAPR